MKPPVLSDGKPDLWERLWADIERQFLQGSGTTEPRGIFAQAGIDEKGRVSVMVATTARPGVKGGESS